MAVLVGYPLILSLLDSLRVDNLIYPADQRFIGISNYLTVLEDPHFRQAVANTLWYFGLVTVGCLMVGLVMATWLHSLARFRAALLAVVILPWAVPGVVNGLLWTFVFNPSNGLLDSLARWAQLIHSNVVWLAHPVIGRALISLTVVWQVAPITAVILLAGLESIPTDLYEQASVDGATRLGAFRRITVPLLRPALAIALVEAGVLGIGVFDQVYVLTGYAPTTMSTVIQIYLYAFQNLNFGTGIAASLMLTVGTLVISLAYLKLVYREVVY
ncbi:MAG: carbohydrate ABC transporter permease [Acidimicrobiales bacterium]